MENGRKSVTLVHKGNIMKFTEGGFRDWGYDVASREYGAQPIGDGPWLKLPNGIVIKDCIADAFLQEILLHPENFDVVATLNLNGDYISDGAFLLRLWRQTGGSPELTFSPATFIRLPFPGTRCGGQPFFAGEPISGPSPSNISNTIP